jgi:hypothetical protein
MGLLFDDNVDAINFWALIDDSAIATIEFYTPAPGSLGLLALGGLAAARRRR